MSLIAAVSWAEIQLSLINSTIYLKHSGIEQFYFKVSPDSQSKLGQISFFLPCEFMDLETSTMAKAILCGHKRTDLLRNHLSFLPLCTYLIYHESNHFLREKRNDQFSFENLISKSVPARVRQYLVSFFIMVQV